MSHPDGGTLPLPKPRSYWEQQAGVVAPDHPEYGTNPKDAEARRSSKARLDLLEPAANTETAHALAFGADKYGVQNYLQIPIHARVYLAAIQRHLDAWKAGEDTADDSGVHHLGHIAANVHVALAAMAAGTFVDDRGPAEPKDASISDPAKVDN
jgi:hypothetical protein